MKPILAYHPHVHVKIDGKPYVLCLDVPDFIGDEDLEAKVLGAIGDFGALLRDPEGSRAALATLGISEVHLHRAQ